MRPGTRAWPLWLTVLASLSVIWVSTDFALRIAAHPLAFASPFYVAIIAIGCWAIGFVARRRGR